MENTHGGVLILVKLQAEACKSRNASQIQLKKTNLENYKAEFLHKNLERGKTSLKIIGSVNQNLR